MIIFLDVDEVLADFVGGACRTWGISKEEVEAVWNRGTWEIVPPLSKALKRGGVRGPDNDDEFWQKIHHVGEDFWTNLDPLPWAKDVVSYLSSLTKDWYVVSSPSLCPTSYSGKVKWFRWFFGETFNQFILTTHKHLLARRDAVLIDDRESNLSAFKKAGGGTVVFPRIHNSSWIDRLSPLDSVKKQMSQLQESQYIS